MEETLVYIRRAHQGDKAARDALVTQNLGLVWSVVHRFDNRGLDREELFQIGSIGLLKAIDRFDLNYEVCFSTYAVPVIMGEIRRFLRDDGLVKVSRSLKENNWKIQRAREKLCRALGREPRMEEVAEETGLSSEEMILAMESSREVESIYGSVYQADGSEITLADRLAEQSNEHELLENRMLVEHLMEELTPQERTLIRLRYFEDATQSQTADVLGTSQVQVSRMEKKILLRLRKSMSQG